MIDAVELRALLALEDHATVAAAAMALGYTPSAVSQQLKRLEQKVGTELTHPVGRNILLTSAGRALARHGRDLLRQWDDLHRHASQFDDKPHGTITVAAFPTAWRGLLSPAVRELRRRAPELTVRAVESDITPALDAVRAGRYDACIVHGWRGLATPVPPELTSDLLGEDCADVVLRDDHPKARTLSVTPADLIEDRWIIQPPGTVCHRWFLHMFASAGRTPEIVGEASEYSSQLQMVSDLGAVALIPRLGVHLSHPNLVRKRLLDPEATRDLHLVSRPGFSTTAAHSALLVELATRTAMLEQLAI